MIELFNTILIQPLTYVLTSLAPLVGGYGAAIILLTLAIRLLLVPLTLPSLKATSKIRDLQPEIDALKKKYKDDKVGLQKAQLELFQKHQVNPAAGCLPNIFQFIILIAMYQVISRTINPDQVNGMTQFLWLNITQPDRLFILPVIAAVTQFILGVMLLPATSTVAEQQAAAATKDKTDDAKAEDMTAMAQSMQQQMIYIMPFMTLFFAYRFPAGLALYWVITTVFSIGQQYFVSGWGGLPAFIQKITSRIKPASKS